MPWEAISERDKKLTRGIEIGTHNGIEIGALNNPIIPPSLGMVESSTTRPKML